MKHHDDAPRNFYRIPKGGPMTDQPSASDARPLTGGEYLESMHYNRAAWIYGERVDDVICHLTHCDNSGMVTQLYDALRDPAQNSPSVVPTDTGSRNSTHSYLTAPQFAESFRARTRAIEKGTIPAGAKKFSTYFVVPTNYAGLKNKSRPPCEYIASVSPFDQPLSSRIGENDGMLIFDHPSNIGAAGTNCTAPLRRPHQVGVAR
jgi:aromatic ring hydroxylase